MNESPDRQEQPEPARRVAAGTPITEREAEDVEERATPHAGDLRGGPADGR